MFCQHYHITLIQAYILVFQLHGLWQLNQKGAWISLNLFETWLTAAWSYSVWYSCTDIQPRMSPSKNSKERSRSSVSTWKKNTRVMFNHGLAFLQNSSCRHISFFLRAKHQHLAFAEKKIFQRSMSPPAALESLTVSCLPWSSAHESAVIPFTSRMVRLTSK